MFKKLLVANRGEIALRIICACKELGIPTVAVYSEADSQSLHVRFADEAVCIGPARPQASYLNIPAILSVAEITGADAVHPGYGFLSEDPVFAEVCDTCGIKFIGPSPEMIRLQADKCGARRKMEAAGLPVLPGSDTAVGTVEEAGEWARKIGYPVLIKAVAGESGFGIRCVKDPKDLAPTFASAQREAAAVMGSDQMYLEKWMPAARHIEFQVLVDEAGNAVHLGERECSVQRRFQKVMEESPSVALDSEKRNEMGQLVEKIFSEIGYTNAGSMEFLMDEAGQLYFIEMTARIQREHPVTELVTGINLVKSQILLASGMPLQEIVSRPLELRGHSIGCSIHAESPRTFAPSSGEIKAWNVPGGFGVRVDSACYAECRIQPQYDTMLAKLMVHGQDRTDAVHRMSRALDMFVMEGVETSIPLLQKIIADPDFQSGNYDSTILERYHRQPQLVQS